MNNKKEASRATIKDAKKTSGTSIKKGIVYVFIANVVNLIISLFTAFILPKILSVDTYANIKLFTLYVTYLGILHLGYSDGMYLRVGGKTIDTIDSKAAKTEFDTFKIFQIVMCFLMMGASLIVGNQILLLCSLVVLPVGVSNYVRNLYVAVGEFKKYSRYTNIHTIMTFIVNLILLLIIKTDNYLFYIIAYVVVYFLYWVFIECELRKILGKPKRKIKFEKNYLKENIGSGIFLMTGNFCNVIFTSIDRLFVKNLLGMVNFAYYSFAVGVENYLNIFITPISTTMYNYFCKQKSKERVVRVKRYSLLLAAAIVVFAFPAKFVIELWLNKYLDSVSVLFFLVSAQYVAIMVKTVHVNLYKSNKQQKKYFKIMLCVIGVSVLLNTIGYLLFKNMIAIAVATLITNFIWFIIGEIDLRKYALNLKDYIYFIINLAAFLFCGLRFGAIAGIIVYLIIVLLNSLIFEFETCKKLMSEFRKIISRFMKRKK
ncbi:oligosaccharide flippase family protein [Candidatus Saccharibacteria bacterium]|nr:oligosaccharide flippase family protein [Candidatus Saccharibacteria bacterium]